MKADTRVSADKNFPGTILLYADGVFRVVLYATWVGALWLTAGFAYAAISLLGQAGAPMPGMVLQGVGFEAALSSVLLLHVLVWVPVVVLTVFLFRKWKTRKRDWVHFAVSLLLLTLFSIPQGYWQRPFIHLNGLPEEPARFFVHTASMGDAGLLRLLLDKGLDPKPELLNAAFFNAGMEGQVAAMRFLLEQRADIDYQHGGLQSTALMSAAALGHGDAVRFLLDKGADASLKDSRGHTALDKAKQFGREEMAALLKAQTQGL